MPVLKYYRTPAEKVAEGVERKLFHTGDIMTVLIDFSNGPWKEPEPPHSHFHSQTCYIAEGEIMFYWEGESALNRKEKRSNGYVHFLP